MSKVPNKDADGHDWMRYILNLSDDDPRSYEFYAEVIAHMRTDMCKNNSIKA